MTCQIVSGSFACLLADKSIPTSFFAAQHFPLFFLQCWEEEAKRRKGQSKWVNQWVTRGSGKQMLCRVGQGTGRASRWAVGYFSFSFCPSELAMHRLDTPLHTMVFVFIFLHKKIWRDMKRTSTTTLNFKRRRVVAKPPAGCWNWEYS